MIAQLLLPSSRGIDHGRQMFFAIAAAPSGQGYTKAFNKTLVNITQMYLPRSAGKLETLAIELPENGSFSAKLLVTLCEKFEGKHVVAVLIVGDSPAAFTVSLAARHSSIPVLWARGHSGFLPGFRTLVSCFVLTVFCGGGRRMFGIERV